MVCQIRSGVLLTSHFRSPPHVATGQTEIRPPDRLARWGEDLGFPECRFGMTEGVVTLDSTPGPGVQAFRCCLFASPEAPSQTHEVSASMSDGRSRRIAQHPGDWHDDS